MNTHKIIKQTATELELLITVDKTQLTTVKNEVVDRLKKDLKVAGFRPGKVPTNIAERHLDSATLQSEVLERVISRSYGETILELKLMTISSPKIELKKFVPYDECEYSAKVALMPKIDYDYTKLRVKYPSEKLDKAEIDKALDNIARQTATKKASKVGAKLGDEIKFDYEGVRAGKPVEGAKAQNQTITLGQGQFIPGFEDHIVGMKAGATKSFVITFPKDYRASDLAGKKVDFTIKLHEVTTIDLPEQDDAWAKSVGPFENLKQLRADVIKRLEQEHDSALTKRYENMVIDEAIKKAKIDAPELLLEDQLQNLEHEFTDNLKNSGLDKEKYLALMGRDAKSLDDELKEEATKRVQMALLIRQIVEKEQIGLEVAEIDATIAQLRQTYTDPKMLEHIEHDHFRDDIANHLLSSKAIAKLVSYAKGDK